MQHGLDNTNTRNLRTIEQVQHWYLGHCGVVQPRRSHWRGLTACLIEELDHSATRLASCVQHVAVCPTRCGVEAQLTVFMRRLSRQEWRELIEDAVMQVDSSLAAARILEKNISQLEKALLESPLPSERLRGYARNIAYDAVCREAALCPVTADDLKSLGLAGRAIGVAKTFVADQWKANPTLSRDQLLVGVREYLKLDVPPRGDAAPQAYVGSANAAPSEIKSEGAAPAAPDTALETPPVTETRAAPKRLVARMDPALVEKDKSFVAPWIVAVVMLILCALIVLVRYLRFG